MRKNMLIRKPLIHKASEFFLKKHFIFQSKTAHPLMRGYEVCLLM